MVAFGDATGERGGDGSSGGDDCGHVFRGAVEITCNYGTVDFGDVTAGDGGDATGHLFWSEFEIDDNCGTVLVGDLVNRGALEVEDNQGSSYFGGRLWV